MPEDMYIWQSQYRVPEPGRRLEVEWNQRSSQYNAYTSKLSTVGRTTNHSSINSQRGVFRSDNYDDVKTNENKENGYYIGPSYATVLRWRYIEEPQVSIKSEEFLQEGASVFTATTVKAKGGHRAQVTYNGAVVWESTTVYASDEGFDEGRWEDGDPQKPLGSQEKAQTAANKAVQSVVEDLFSKVKG